MSTVPSTEINKQKLYLIAGAAALGGLLFGFDTAVISGATPFLEQKFNLDKDQLGNVVSSMLLGCMAGTLLVRGPSDRFGRKNMLMLSAVLFLISALGSAFADTLFSFISYRLIGGFAVGAASMLSPVYIAEISPKEYRGALVSLNQFTIVLGITISFFSNAWFVGLSPEVNWRWMLGVEAVPSVAFLVALFFVPASPRWLMLKGREEEARATLNQINTKERTPALIQEIKATLNSDVKSQSKWADLFSSKYGFIVYIGVVLAVLQQITGINIIMYYAPQIFMKTGMGADTAIYQSAGIGVTMLIFTALAMRYVDRLGRVPLSLGGIAVMLLMLLGIAWKFYTQDFGGYTILVMILIYISAFSISIGPIVWVQISELFPNRIRGKAVAFATFMMWGANYLVTRTFPVLLDYFEGEKSAITFLIYAFFCIVMFVFVWRVVPETKGKSLEEIEKELVKE